MSALSQIPNKKMSREEYLTFDRASDVKHEHIDGTVVAMTGASHAHSLICSYTIATLINQIGDKPCAVYPADICVNIPATGLYTYPDISIVCGAPEFTGDSFDTLVNPILIVEVLSPSTEAYDRGTKFQHYRKLPSLQEYVLISQNKPRIERFQRQNDLWTLTDAETLDTLLELSSIECCIALKDIYRKVTFSA